MHFFKILLLIGIWASSCVLPTLTLTVSEAIQQKVLRRTNAGVTFRFQSQIVAHRENFVHHLIFDLPQHTNSVQFEDLQQELNLTVKDLVTPEFLPSPLSSILNRIISFQTNHVTRILENIYQLIPEISYNPNQNRGNRALCTICGEFRKALEGVALTSDLEQLNEIVEKSANLTQRHFESIEKSLGALSSYSRINDQKIEALSKIAQSLRQSSSGLLASIGNNKVALHHITATLAAVNNFFGVADDLLLLHNAIIMMKHGFLTFDLIPFAQAKSVLGQIQAHLADTPFLYLANTNPMSIYTATQFYHFRVREQIHLGLRLKLSPFTRPLALFKVETFQLNLGPDQHSTILAEQPSYIALNDEDDIYLTFQEKPTLKDDKFYFLGQEQHIILSKSNPTCILSLFDDEPVAFNEKCTTYLRPYVQPPFAMQLGENLMFFQNLKAYTVTESNGREHEIQLQCSSCTKQMRCNTKISTIVGIFYMAPCKSLRQNQQDTHITGYVTNLHALTPFLDRDLISKLSAEYSFATSINFSFPKIKFFKNEDPSLSAAFRTLDTPQISLDSVINQTLQDGVVFKSESDKIIYDLQKLGLQLQSQFSWSALTSWIINPFSLPTNLCILALLIAVVYLFFRVRSLATMIIMLQQVRPVEVQTISFQEQLQAFLKQKREKITTQPTFFNIPLKFEPQISRDFHVLDLLIFLTIIAISLYLLWRKFKSRQQAHSFEIVLEIICRYDRVKVSLMKLPHTVDAYVFTASEFISYLSLRGLRKPKLHIHWPTLKVKHRLLNLNVDLPPVHSVNYWTACKLRKILSSNYEVLLFTRQFNTNIYQIVPLLGSTWNSLQSGRSTQAERPLHATQSLMLSAPDIPHYV
jgi:uncharacterized protein YhbP (UPF0306 family)